MTKTKKAPAKSKATSPAISKIAEETKKLRIENIVLVESFSRRGGFKDDKLPTVLHQQMGMDVEILHNPETKTDDMAIAKVKAAIWACCPDDGPDKAAFEVRATFHLTYEIAEPIKGVGEDDTVKTIAVMNIFPYWREFVQSTTVRMGLPALLIPLADVAKVSGGMKKIVDSTKKAK